jgi:DNA-directed RNA polymerase alpha subunit
LFNFDHIEQLEREAEQRRAEEQKTPFDFVFLTLADELPLSIRSANCLRNDNIVYVGDLVQRTEAAMLRTPNFGRKSLNEIKEVLATMKLRLGMEVRDWPPADPAKARKLIGTVYVQKVDELQLSIRSANCLRNDKIIYIGELVQRTEAEMLRTPNFGRKSLHEITTVLAEIGLHLGMEVAGWPIPRADAGRIYA